MCYTIKQSDSRKGRFSLRILTYTVSAADDGRAVRSVVPSRFHLGAHAFRRLKAQELIRVDGQIVRADRILREGEIIELRLPGEDSATNAAVAPPALSGLPASAIRYMDEDLIVVSKGAPLATLPDAHSFGSTLREQLCAMLAIPPERFRYHPVNRLDKGTSGLLVVARHAHAQRLLGAQLHTDGFIREYLAVTEGIPACPAGVIDSPIAHPGPGARRAVSPEGKPAVTRYETLSVSDSRALLRLRLKTGRTHQIRVHLASIGCPIVGDYLYGSELPELCGRFALHSAYLRFKQPITGQSIELEDPLPENLRSLL